MGKQRYRWFVLSVAVILSSAYLFVFSKSGLLERMKLDGEKKNIITRTEALKSENSRLHRVLERYRSGKYPDDDIASSGYMRPNDAILVFRDLEEKAPGITVKKKTVAGFIFELSTLRILWIALSSVVLIMMLVYGRHIKEQQAP